MYGMVVWLLLLSLGGKGGKKLWCGVLSKACTGESPKLTVDLMETSRLAQQHYA